MVAKTESRSPQKAPDFQLYRIVDTIADVLPEIDVKHGINMGNYRRAIIDVKAEDGANPAVAVLFWSEATSAFVAENPAITRAGAGVDTGYQFSVECNGRIMFVAVTGGLSNAAHIATISIAGFELDHTL